MNTLTLNVVLPRYRNFLCHMSLKFISRYEHDMKSSSGSNSVFLMTKYTINSDLFLYNIMILLNVTIYNILL